MEFVLAMFGFGSLLLLAGVVGGDLTFQGATIPKIGRLPRFTLSLLGGGLIVTSGVLWALIALPGEGGEGPAPAVSAPGDAVTATVTRDLAPFHRQETLELFVDQRHVGTLTVDEDDPHGSLEITLPGSEVGYDAVLHARGPANEQSEFSGSGTLTTATSFRVRLDRSSTTVELVPVSQGLPAPGR